MKIKSICEAFSMHPSCFYITEKEPERNKELYTKEIKLEQVGISDGSVEGMSNYDVYVGYNWEGNKSFQYLANSVNVNYTYE